MYPEVLRMEKHIPDRQMIYGSVSNSIAMVKHAQRKAVGHLS